MTLASYLLFEGSCAQAMEFYHAIFGGELHVLKVKDSPAKDHMAAFQQEKVLNAQVKSGELMISASDWLLPNRTAVRGNTVCMYLTGGSTAETRDIFERLSEGADVIDPLTQMFYGLYGALTDKFGVRWMFVANDAA
jgi:PhnB protein